MANLLPLDLEKCWEWNGGLAGSGYGTMGFFRRKYYVHRVSYRLFCGEIPHDKIVCHKCDNPKCFNPNHLFLGTSQDNFDDMEAKGRRVVGDHSGKNNGNCRYSDEIILKIRTDFESGIPQRDLRSAYGVSQAQLYRIVRYKTRPHLRPIAKVAI